MRNYLLAKRIIDIGFAIFLLPFLVVFSSLAGIILIFEHREWPLFKQTRSLELNGKHFTIYKLKTMRSSLNHRPRSANIFLKPELYFEIPRFSKFLRKSGLDETPQIINILRGEMSFVGPRPLMIYDLQLMKRKFPHEYKQRKQLKSKPGITGIWQLFCLREEGVKNLIELDGLYEKSRSLALDLKIMILTTFTIITGTNSDAIIIQNIFPFRNILDRFDKNLRVNIVKRTFWRVNTAVKNFKEEKKLLN